MSPLLLAISDKHRRFADAYIEHGNASKAARTAGYEGKHVGITGYKLLKNPLILAYIKDWKEQRTSKWTKDDFISKAVNCYEALPVEMPIKAKYLEIAGKTLGHMDNSAPQSVHNTLIVNNLQQENVPLPQKWDNIRGLLEG